MTMSRDWTKRSRFVFSSFDILLRHSSHYTCQATCECDMQFRKIHLCLSCNHSSCSQSLTSFARCLCAMLHDIGEACINMANVKPQHWSSPWRDGSAADVDLNTMAELAHSATHLLCFSDPASLGGPCCLLCTALSTTAANTAIFT